MSTENPNFDNLLAIYQELAEITDAVRFQFEIDRSYQIARRECGIRSLSAFKAGFKAYQQRGES
jgi:hypothetical protein